MLGDRPQSRVIGIDDVISGVAALVRPAIRLVGYSGRACGCRAASFSRMKSRLLCAPNRRRRILKKAEQVGLPDRVGLGKDALQVGA